MKMVIWKKTDSKTTTLTLVAQSDPELKYLNHLIFEGKALASGDNYAVILNLKEGKSVVDYKVFLSTKLHFQIEQET